MLGNWLSWMFFKLSKENAWAKVWNFRLDNKQIKLEKLRAQIYHE